MDNDLIFNMSVAIDNSRDYIERLSQDRPSKIGLANYERLCKLSDQIYVICSEYCCGEFWESAPKFCCSNNFKPIRNFFFFLLIAFVVLFSVIVMYLLVESLAKSKVLLKIRELADRIEVTMPNIKGMQLIGKDLFSNDTSEDDESSLDERIAISEVIDSPPPQHVLRKHSQSFKNMSKLNTLKRQARIKSGRILSGYETSSRNQNQT